MIGLAGYPRVAMEKWRDPDDGASRHPAGQGRSLGTEAYQRTQLRILLAPEERPRADDAQQLIGLTLQEVYRRFAQYFAVGGVLCFLGSFVLPG